MTHKEKAIETLESVAHWMKTSTFDYDEKGLKILLNDAFIDYKRYLKYKQYGHTKQNNNSKR